MTAVVPTMFQSIMVVANLVRSVQQLPGKKSRRQCTNLIFKCVAYNCQILTLASY